MKSVFCLVLAVVCVLAFACSESTETIPEESDVNLDTVDHSNRVIFVSELIADPLKYDGKIITVSGYVIKTTGERHREKEVIILSDAVFRAKYPLREFGAKESIDQLTESRGLIITGEISDVPTIRLDTVKFGELHTFKIQFFMANGLFSGIFFSAMPFRTVYNESREFIGGLPVEKEYHHEGCPHLDVGSWELVSVTLRAFGRKAQSFRFGI